MQKSIDGHTLILGIVLSIPMLMTISALKSHGKPELTFPFIASFTAIVLLIRINWRLKRHLWFWEMILLLIGIHIAVMLLFPWNSSIPAPIILLIAMADTAILHGAISRVNKLFHENHRSEGKH